MRRLNGIRNKNDRFQRHIHEDIKNILLNNAEYARDYLIDGRRVRGVVSSLTLGNTSLTQNKDLLNIGIEQGGIILYCPSEDLSPDYLNRETMTLDHKIYRILKSSDENGMYCFTMLCNQSKGGILR